MSRSSSAHSTSGWGSTTWPTFERFVAGSDHYDKNSGYSNMSQV